MVDDDEAESVTMVPDSVLADLVPLFNKHVGKVWQHARRRRGCAAAPKRVAEEADGEDLAPPATRPKLAMPRGFGPEPPPQDPFATANSFGALASGG